MRFPRTTWALACLGVMAPALANAQGTGGHTAKELLGLSPILKKGVEYETPADPAAINACKVETVANAQKRAIGYALRDSQGKLLRKFVDSDGDGVMDQWSFYQDGFEVYRESDKNKDKSPDECRWLNSAGTRIGSMAPGGKITGWKRISAEESSKVLVQALVGGDIGLLATVLATPEELEKLGLPKGAVDQATAASAQRVDQVKALLKGLTGWSTEFVWNRLDGTMPHTIPADPDSGLSQDLVLYENAVIFAGPVSGELDMTKVAFLQAPEMVKLGEVWKFVELPRAIPPGKAIVAASDGGLRSWLFRSQFGGVPATAQNVELEAALKELAAYDQANSSVLTAGDKKAIAQYHVGRVPLLRGVVKVSKTPDESLSYNRQIIDSLVAAVQTGLFPAGERALEQAVKEDPGGKLISYAAFRKIAADFALRNDEPGTNLMANQKKWMGDLKGFLESYPKSDEAPDALLQLASAYEFNAEEEEARKYYAKLAQEFSTTEPGKKAAGALRRLDLVGKPLVVKATGLKGEDIDTSKARGRLLLVTFWATWADPVKRDLPELAKIYQKHRGDGLEIVGVSLDSEKTELEAFLKDNPLAWPQVFEPGGMDSRLATEFGIISLPTMILVDGQGKVVNRNIRTAAELERQLEKMAGAKQPGVALESKD